MSYQPYQKPSYYAPSNQIKNNRDILSRQVNTK